jgi:hypothetical protein
MENMMTLYLNNAKFVIKLVIFAHKLLAPNVHLTEFKMEKTPLNVFVRKIWMIHFPSATGVVDAILCSLILKSLINLTQLKSTFPDKLLL